MIIIENLLINVDVEKRNNIINSAMKEFSINSFRNASTNVIVEEAGISKGLLYHYFGTKEKLYKYLEYFCIKVIMEGITNELDWDQNDIFIRLKDISIIKFKALQKHPYLTEFSLVAFQGKTVEDIMKISPNFSIELYSQIYTRNIDYTLFKENIDVKYAINIIKWTLEKYSEECRMRIKEGTIEFNYKLIEKDMCKYIDMLKECFYK